MTDRCLDADADARQACLSRGKCEASGFRITCRGPLVWAHILSRRHHSIRHDPQNCLCLCLDHELMFTNSRNSFVELLNERFPGRLEELEQKRSKIVSWHELQDIYGAWIEYYRTRA